MFEEKFLDSLKQARRIHGTLVFLCTVQILLVVALSLPDVPVVSFNAFGVNVSSPHFVLYVLLSLIPFYCFYFGVHLKHLRELSRYSSEEFENYLSDASIGFSWILIFRGWEAGVVTFFSVFLMPCIIVFSIEELPPVKYWYALPCGYAWWQAHKLRQLLHTLASNNL